MHPQLASPHPDAKHETAVKDSPATLDAIRSALAGLAGEQVKPNDRVFIYYSGHGCRMKITTAGAAVHREALVPVDFASSNLLFDYELNRLLAAIASRTQSITVVLDCCHSSGVTRSAGDMIARNLQPDDIPKSVTAPPVDASGLARGIDNCHVICACLDHESAYESRAADGQRNGLLTRALVAALRSLEHIELRDVPVARIWEAVRDRVEAENSAQHVWMSGNPARLLLGGPPVDGDAGFSITPAGESYTIHAGTIAGVTDGAEIGVYPQRPAFFPPLGSADDGELRIATLSVTRAERSSAHARSAAPFVLPPGARGRLVKAGAAARLRCAIRPQDAEVATLVRESPLLELAATGAAQVHLEIDQRDWIVTDDVHGTATWMWPLFRFVRENPREALAVLEHYARYALPVQIANRALDLPGALKLSARVVPAVELAPDAAQTTVLPEATGPAAGTYDVPSGARLAFQVDNASGVALRVTLVNSAASGKVQMLGEQTLEPGSAHVFWSAGKLGTPFIVNPPPGAVGSIDRLIAIGRNAMDRDLDFLRLDRKFSELIRPRGVRGDDGGARDFDDPPAATDGPPPEQWTAHQALVRARR